VLFEIQSFHHLSNPACPLVLSINLPIYSSTRQPIPWELSQLPASCEKRVLLDVSEKAKLRFRPTKTGKRISLLLTGCGFTKMERLVEHLLSGTEEAALS
jgi:hypothetical protein